MAPKIRLQKMLADAGFASRRKAEEYIGRGQVTVNGRRASIGDKVDPRKDLVAVNGKQIRSSGKRVYIALHKPRGFITTMQDERDRKCVASLVTDIGERVYPIGRLDRDSEGLLLMTNDGDFANKIMHPSSHIAKTYRVTIDPAMTEEQLVQFCTGIIIDGRKTAPAKAKVLEQYEKRAILEVVLYEGRNREIRKMCEALGIKVLRLKRIAEGPVRLGRLKAGSYRELKKEEMQGLISEAAKGGNRDDRNKAGAGSGKSRRAYSKKRPQR